MEALLIYGAYALGLVVVVIFSVMEFNAPAYSYHTNGEDLLTRSSAYARLAQPVLPRYMTPCYSYSLFVVIFALVAGGLYVMVTQLLLGIPGMETVFGKGNEPAAAIFSALVLVGIVKSDDINVKAIRWLVKWPKILMFVMFKNWMHGFAQIPALGRDVFERLCFEPIDLESKAAQDIIDDALNRNCSGSRRAHVLEEDFHYAGNCASLVHRWARLSYFIHAIELWAQDFRFKNHVEERSLGWLKLRNAYGLTAEEMAQFRDKNQGMSQDREQALSQQVDTLLAYCYRLISCVIIMTVKAGEDPLSYLRELGLSVRPGEQIFTRKGRMYYMILVMIAVIAGLTLAFVLSDPGADKILVIDKILTNLKAAFFIMVFPFLLVSEFKRQLAMNRTWPVVTSSAPYSSFFDMPLMLYSMISILSWGISLFFMMVAFKGQWIQDPAEWKNMSIFCSISAVTAFIACYRMDLPRRVFSKKRPYWLCVLRLPVLHGLLTAGIVWLGLIIKPDIPSQDLWQYPAMGFFAPLVMGYTLFSGKHILEKRRPDPRIPCREGVILVQGEKTLFAVMLNKSRNGGLFRLEQGGCIQEGTQTIQIIFKDGLKKIGSIRKKTVSLLNVAYAS